MPTSWQGWAGRLGKWLLTAAILGAVGWQFYNDLSKLDPSSFSVRPGWLGLSALLYVAFIGTSCWYWRRLLALYGTPPSFAAAARAYYVSQLGKYLPGKALTLVIRGAIVRGPEIGLGVAILTSFYEVLATMTAGALLATVALMIAPPVSWDLPLPPPLVGLILAGACGTPLVPAVFNRVVGLLTKKATAPSARIDARTLLQGLAVSAGGWCMLAVGVWAGLVSVMPEPPPLDAGVWLRCLGAIGLAYVGGFLAVFMPGGIGVREYVLLHVLGFAGPAALVATAVLLMRLAWTAADVIVAAALYPRRFSLREEVPPNERPV